MNLHINITGNGVTTYPLHKHKYYEIMLYLAGNGCLRTEQSKLPFSPGTIIIIPPDLIHGSASDYGFKNISIGGDFQHLLYTDQPVILKDNDAQEGKELATMIFNNRYGNHDFLTGLCNAYLHFLLQHIQTPTPISQAVSKIISRITEQAADPSLNLPALLHESGYAEDYIRAQFKKITGQTPVEFLTRIRIDHACYLINIYGTSVPLLHIAELSGYEDYTYFSRKFRQLRGFSPRDYLRSIL